MQLPGLAGWAAQGVAHWQAATRQGSGRGQRHGDVGDATGE
jgi:hypothetical protein